MNNLVYWLVYLDTDEDPLLVRSVSKEDATDQVQKWCYNQGYGELNVGPIGVTEVVRANAEEVTVNLSHCHFLHRNGKLWRRDRRLQNLT